MPDLTDCTLWKDPGATLSRPMKDVFSLDWEKRYDGHFWRYALTCRECGQSYFFQFVEKIDWDQGLDEQLSIYVPFAGETALEALKKTSHEDLLHHTPRLQKYNPIAARTIDLRWITEGGAP